MKTGRKEKKSVATIVLFSILLLYTCIFLFLLIWAVLTSVKTDNDFIMNKNYYGLPRDVLTGELLLPWDWNWTNFVDAAERFKVTDLYRSGQKIAVPFGTQIWYTILYAVGCAFFQTLCPCMAAYFTSKFNYKFNKIIDVVVIITMIIPVVGSSISMISLLHKLNIYDTFLGLYLQKFYFANMYYLMFGGIFKGISKEYYEAAHIDGASEFSVMIRIALPLVINSFGLIFLLHFIAYWNDYSTLLLYAPSHPTIAYGLYVFSTRSPGNDLKLASKSVQMAGAITIAIPTVILFIVFHNKLMGNLSIGGVKE